MQVATILPGQGGQVQSVFLLTLQCHLLWNSCKSISQTLEIYLHLRPHHITIINTIHVGTSLAVLWLRCYSPNAGGLGSIPGQGTRSHMLQSQHSQKKKRILYMLLPVIVNILWIETVFSFNFTELCTKEVEQTQLFPKSPTISFWIFFNITQITLLTSNV